MLFAIPASCGAPSSFAGSAERFIYLGALRYSCNCILCEPLTPRKPPVAIAFINTGHPAFLLTSRAGIEPPLSDLVRDFDHATVVHDVIALVVCLSLKKAYLSLPLPPNQDREHPEQAAY